MNAAGIEPKQAAPEKAKLLDQVREVIRLSIRTEELKAKRKAVAMLETPLPMVPVCSEQTETVRPIWGDSNTLQYKRQYKSSWEQTGPGGGRYTARGPIRPFGFHPSHGFPTEGWVFPADSKSGHIEQGSAKNQHLKALARSGVKPFAPYCLRHTALTNVAGICDSFTLSTIAGHSSVTERYIHPQAKTIAEAFEKITDQKKVVIAGGHSENPKAEIKSA